MKSDAITIYDIAKEAGVSPATVSRVLNGTAKVKEEKRLRVLEAVEKYSFTPNAMAQGLSNQETKTIGVLMSDIRNPFYSTVYVGIESAAISKGYNVILCNALNDDDTEQQHLEMLESKSVDAIIMAGGHTDDIDLDEEYSQLLRHIMEKTPVIISGEQPNLPCSTITMDDRPGMEALMAYLIGLGHRRFALVGGRSTKVPTARKQRLFREILERNGLGINPKWIIETDGYELTDGYVAGKKLMRGEEMPTAVLGTNELTALGAVKAFAEGGLRIPQDVSVAGFDDTYLANMSIPTLTSVGCMYDELGEQLMQLVLESTGKNPVIRRIAVPTGLTVRRSCGTPRTENV